MTEIKKLEALLLRYPKSMKLTVTRDGEFRVQLFPGARYHGKTLAAAVRRVPMSQLRTEEYDIELQGRICSGSH